MRWQVGFGVAVVALAVGAPMLAAPVVAAPMLAAPMLAAPVLAAPVTMPTNMPGVVTYPAPPSGFDAVHAADADLAAYGFPARPKLAGRGEALLAWEHFVRLARFHVTPILEPAGFLGGPPRGRLARLAGRDRNGTYQYTTKNWSGQVVSGSGNGLGAGAYSFADSKWNVPAVVQAFGVCTGGWDYESNWVGLDGWNNLSVLQAGTESDAYCAASNPSQFYSAWIEWYPAQAMRVTNLPVSPGQVVAIGIAADTATTGHAFMINGTTGAYVIVGVTAPAGTSFHGNSAEWIVERPTGANQTLTTLSNYGATWMGDLSMQMYGSSQGYNFGALPPGAPLYNLTMNDDQGNAISPASQQGASALLFENEGSSR